MEIVSTITVYGNEDINKFQNYLDMDNYLNVRCRCEVNDKDGYVNYFFTSHSQEEYDLVYEKLRKIVRLINYEF